MDLQGLIREMTTDGSLNTVALNPRAQFGRPGRRLLGATLLPEKIQEQNEYTEQGIKYRTIVANSGTRYSPTQIKGGAMTGTMRVSLAESDIASILTSRDLDALIALLGRNMSMQGAAQVADFVNTTINQALVELNEVHRWQAIVNALVQLRGDNEYMENVAYTNPAGHRINVAGTWSNNSYDPFADIFAQAQLFTNKGYAGTARIITSRRVVNIMAMNAKVLARTNTILTVGAGGQVGATTGRGTLASINAALAADGLPQIETYDLQYRTMTGTARFIPDTVMVMVASTGVDAGLDLGDRIELVPNTLGYVGVGRPAGQSRPGRVIRAEVKENKPPRVECEGWQTSLPVITEPEGLAVLQAIN